MKKVAVLFLIVAMFIWAIYDFADGRYFNVDDTTVQQESDIPVGLEIGDMAPDFELESLNGEPIKLSELQGKRVMLNFWATWCGPCRAEMPDMQKLYEEKDIHIVAVNMTATETIRENIPSFIDEFQLEFPVLMDETNDVADLYQIKPIPSSYFINSDGTIHEKVFGLLNYEQMMQMYVNMY